MKRGQISNLLRALGLIYLTDRARYYIQKYQNTNINKEFKNKHPNVQLPPDYLIYESFQMNYNKYYTDGRDTAEWLKSYVIKYIELKDKKILDWGCGPGRIIRHLPSVIGNGCKYYGTDYNKKSIEWCINNLPGINFNENSLNATLPYLDNSFDLIYGISIFTHLSKALHYDWYNELYRILKPKGILFLTTQGDNFKVKLTNKELGKYENGELVIRGNVKEGHRTFSAFHPKIFMQDLFKNSTILEHVETKPKSAKLLPQDIWIVQKE